MAASLGAQVSSVATEGMVDPEGTITTTQIAPISFETEVPPRPKAPVDVHGPCLNTWEVFASEELRRWSQHLQETEELLQDLDAQSITAMLSRLKGVDGAYAQVGLYVRARHAEGPGTLTKLAKHLRLSAPTSRPVSQGRGSARGRLGHHLDVLQKVAEHLLTVLKRYNPQELLVLPQHKRRRLPRQAGTTVHRTSMPGRQALVIGRRALQLVEVDVIEAEKAVAAHGPELAKVANAIEERKQELERNGIRVASESLIGAMTGAMLQNEVPSMVEDDYLQRLLAYQAEVQASDRRYRKLLLEHSARHGSLREVLRALAQCVKTLEASLERHPPQSESAPLSMEHQALLRQQLRVLQDMRREAAGFEAALEHVVTKLEGLVEQRQRRRPKPPTTVYWYHLAAGAREPATASDAAGIDLDEQEPAPIPSRLAARLSGGASPAPAPRRENSRGPQASFRPLALRSQPHPSKASPRAAAMAPPGRGREEYLAEPTVTQVDLPFAFPEL